MLSPIDEGQENVDIPDSPAKKLTLVPPVSCSIPEFVGGHGPWQFRQWLVFFYASLCISLYLFSTFPLAAPVDCRCIHTSTLRNASDSDACASGICAEERMLLLNTDCTNPFNTFKTQNQTNAKCFQTDLVIYAKFIYLVGILFSTLMIVPFTKRFSQRVIALLSGLTLFICSLTSGWTEVTANYFALRIISSYAMTNIYFVSILTLLECLGDEYRLLYAFVGHLGWGMAHFVLPLIAWLAQNWKQYNIILSSFSVPMLILSYFIPESIESCMDKGLKARAQKLIRIAAWKNGITTVDVEQFTQSYAILDKKDNLNTSVKFRKFKRIFHLFLLFLVGFSSSFLYFLSLGLSDWSRKDRGSQFALCGTAEVAAVIIVLFFTCFISPKRTWAVSTVCASLSFLLIYAKADNELPKVPTGPFLLAMFFASTSWTISWLRTLFQSFSSTEAKLNTLLSVFGIFLGSAISSLNDLQKYDSWNPKVFVVIGIPNLTIGACIAFIPDRYFTF